jgi:hypothetical protein
MSDRVGIATAPLRHLAMTAGADSLAVTGWCRGLRCMSLRGTP